MYRKRPIRTFVLRTMPEMGFCVMCGSRCEEVLIYTDGLLRLRAFLCNTCYEGINPSKIVDIIEATGLSPSLSYNKYEVHVGSPFEQGYGGPWTYWPGSHPSDLAVVEALWRRKILKVPRAVSEATDEEKAMLMRCGLSFLFEEE